MKKSVFALAALAAIGFTESAVAEDGVTGGWSTITSTQSSAAPMSDSDMDKITAGYPSAQGLANGTGVEHNPNGIPLPLQSKEVGRGVNTAPGLQP